MKHLQQETQAEAVRTRHRTPRRTGIDHFGIAAMILMLAVSLVLYFRVVSSRFLTSKYLLLIMVVLIVVNAIHVFVQLPLRRNKLGKLSRTELVQLIYDIRKTNVALEERCERLEKQLADAEARMLSDETNARLNNIEEVLRAIDERLFPELSEQ